MTAAFRVIEAFEERCCVEPNTGCLLWMSSYSKDGYPIFAGRSAKLVAWELYVDSSVLGRVRGLCSTRPCVNVDHLQLLPVEESSGRRRQRPADTATHSFCNLCKQWVAIEEFAQKLGGKSGRQSYCQPCKTRLAVVRERRLNGWEPGRFERVLAEQHGRCAICRDPLRLGQGGAAADHDHATNRPRGVLCFGCNTLVGKLEVSPRRVRLAAKYIRRHAEAEKPSPQLNLYDSEVENTFPRGAR